MYQNGDYFARNYHKAFEYYIEAAKEGHPAALYNLGKLYENGYGIKRNKPFAKKLYCAAASLGDDEAKERVLQMTSNTATLQEIQEIGIEFLQDYAKDKLKDLISDLVANAVDKILDEDGSIVSEVVGDIVADGIMKGFGLED